jgi:hypothetical protein
VGLRVRWLIRDFAESLGPGKPGQRTWTRGRNRRKRALYVSSPIGLGHVRRDLAIAGELRARHPDLEIDWLTQPPVTQVLEERGERVHPASRWLASESAHIESEAGEHDLNVFQAARRMDEILVANFMVFHDLTSDEPYDLWIADEGWGRRPLPVRQPPSSSGPRTRGSPTSSAGCRCPKAARPRPS